MLLARPAAGVLLALALLLIAVNTYTRAHDTETVRTPSPVPGGAPSVVEREPSAVQVIEVYVEGAFFAVIAVGLAAAAHLALPSSS